MRLRFRVGTAGRDEIGCDRIGRLATPGLEHMGRLGLDPGTRELIEPPYIIVYEVNEAREEIEILYIVDGARNRERK